MELKISGRRPCSFIPFGIMKFPSSLYTCVANGSTDEFVKAEALQQAKAVQNMLQIGFHLSAQVYEITSVANITKTTTQYYHASIIFDRKKITSCHCTCNNSSSWCSHIVAVCLCRIAQVNSVDTGGNTCHSIF